MAQIATGQRDEALDIVQDTMLLLVRRYATRPPQEWGPLFQRILQNRIRDWYRRNKVRARWQAWFSGTEDSQAQLEAIVDPNADDPAQIQSGKVSQAALESCLRDLPLRQQQVFLLRAWEGLDVSQTAAALGVSQGSVKTHYARAMQKVRAIFEEPES